MPEIYFAKNSKFNSDEMDELKNCSYVNRLYTASASTGYFLLGFASKDSKPIPNHNGDDRFNIPIKGALFDYKSEPLYISVIWLNTVLNPSKIMEAFEKWDKDCGLLRRGIQIKADQKACLGPRYKSKLVRAMLSGHLDRKYYNYSQALVLEFDSRYKSSQILANLAKEDIEKTSGSLAGGQNDFSILNKIK